MNRLRSYALPGALALVQCFALSGVSVAAVHTFDQLFELNDQAMWDRDSRRLDRSGFFGATWSAQEIAPALNVPGIANGLLEASITAGRLGFELGVTSGRPMAGSFANNGSIDARIPAALRFHAPDSVVAGQRGVGLDASWALGEDFRFTTTGPTLTATVDLVANGSVSARFSGQVSGFEPFDSGRFDVVRFDNARQRLITAGSGTTVELDVPAGSVTLSVPMGADVEQSTRAGSTVLKGSYRTEPLLALNTDIDALVATAFGLQPSFGIPGGSGVTVSPVSASFSAGANTDLTLDYIDLSLVTGIRFAQDFSLRVDAFQFNVVVRDGMGGLITTLNDAVDVAERVDLLGRFDVPAIVAGNQLQVSFEAYPIVQLVNNSGLVATLDAELTLFGAKARIGGVVLYDDALIEKSLTLAESDPLYIYGGNISYGAPDLGTMRGSFIVPLSGAVR